MAGRPLALLTLVALAGCMNTSRLRGRVVDCQTQSPVEGADVQLASPSTGLKWEAVQTASDGSFAFDVQREAKGASLNLTAVKDGYRSTEKSYPALPGTAQDVCLAPTLR
ncbi:MAG TPA: carboxypeptidase-like regulatory domain-containing protein [Polyangiaceae bacterium]